MESKTGQDKWLSPFWLGVYVFAASFASFYPALQGYFLNWDDEFNFLNNTAWRGLSPAHLKWMFTSFYSTHYTPLTWMTLGLDYKVWDLNPFGYHLSSLLFHGAAAALFFALLRRLFMIALPEGETRTINLSAVFGALFFALHPLRTESVAWITERRDVTGGFFALLSAWLYVRASQDAAREKRLRLCSVAAFAAAVLSRESEAALAPVLLLLDWYSLGRLGSCLRDWFSKERRTVWLEKIPYFALAFFGSFMALAANSEGHVGTNPLGFAPRAAQFIAGLAFYLEKTLLPVGLSPSYAAPGFGMSEAWGALGFLLAAGAAAVFFRRRKAVWVALGVYALFILPTLGVVRTASYAYDRFSYMACLGFAGLFGCAVYALAVRFSGKIVYAVALAIVMVFGALSIRQCVFWGDSLTLWERAVAVSPGPLSYQKRGESYNSWMQYDLARHDFKTALALYPDDADVLQNIGVLELETGNFPAALVYLKKAVSLSPGNWSVHFAQARTLNALARGREAIDEFTFCVRLARDDKQRFTALSSRGDTYLKLGDTHAALEDLQNASALAPENPAAYNNVALAYIATGDSEKALACYGKAIAALQNYVPAYTGRAQLLRKLGRDKEAALDEAVALRLSARFPGPRSK